MDNWEPKVDQESDLLHSPSGNSHKDPHSLTRFHSSYTPLATYSLPSSKQYRQQFSDIYFLRLSKLKPSVDALAIEAWSDFRIADELALPVPRVLDVRQGSLCHVTGTIYLDLPLKPNILEDISKDQWLSAPPPRAKYLSPSGEDKIMLEDESGRLRLVGTILKAEELVTGVIVSVMGTENAEGEFEVVDLRVPDLAPQPPRPSNPEKGKVAIVSGLGISGDEVDSLTLELLMEYLLGEAGDADPTITRLIIAGDSLAPPLPPPAHGAHPDNPSTTTKKTSKKYGYDASSYNPAPTTHLDTFLATLLPSLPVTLIPGASDPANVSLPQQPVHTSLFPHSRAYTSPPSTTLDAAAPKVKTCSFDPQTNPFSAFISGLLFLGTGGQNIDDVFKYVEGDSRLDMMERLLRWRLIAPTAPDTLWCYPFQEDDPFVIQQTPHVFFTGCQPRFETKLIDGDAGEEVRLIAIPRFKETGELILVDLETLAVEVVKIGVVHGEGV